MLKAQESLATAQAQQKAYQQTLKQVQQKFQVGLVAIVDVHDAQARVDQSLSDVIGKENALMDAFEALRAHTANVTMCWRL